MSRVGDFLRKAKTKTTENIIPIVRTGAQITRIATPGGAAAFILKKTGATDFVLDKLSINSPNIFLQPSGSKIPIVKTGGALGNLKLIKAGGAATSVTGKRLDELFKKVGIKNAPQTVPGIPRKIPVYTPENPKRSQYETQPGYYEPKSGNTYTPENPKRSQYEKNPDQQSLTVVSPNYQKNYPDKSDNKKPLALAALGLGLGLAYYLNR